ncbi:MAG: lysophospholipid acyltransferase family protein [Verrucomicrobiales bacterium]
MSLLYRFGHVVTSAAAHCFFDFRVLHRHRLIENGPALIVANHVSYFDPPLIGSAYERPIWFLARKTLFRGFGAWLYPRLNCIPIDQEGSDISGVKTIIRLLRGGERVLLFPEGSRSLDGALQAAEPGVGLVICRANVPVQPLRLFGAHEALPPGSTLPRPSRIRLVVGEPFELAPGEQAGKGRDFYRSLGNRVMKEIAALELPSDL